MNRIVIIILLNALSASQVFSQVIEVPGDQPSIQSAIEAASAGDTILVEEGTYDENINFLGKAITVASRFIMDGETAHISRTIIDGSKATNPDTASVVTMWSGEDTTSVLMGFTIRGGKGTKSFPMVCESISDDFICGAGIFISDAGGKITNNIIEGNHQVEIPGKWGHLGCGLYANNSGDHEVIIRDNIIRGNTGKNGVGWGAGVVLIGGDYLFEHNEIRNNTLDLQGIAQGGGMQYWMGCEENDYAVTIRNNYIIGNEALSESQYGYGGGVGLYGGKALEFYNNIVAENYADGYGGALDIIWTDKHIIYQNTVYNNSALKRGNSISFYDCDLVFFNNIIWGNSENGISEYFSEGTWSKGCFINNILRVKPTSPAYSFLTLADNFDYAPDFSDDTYTLAEGSPGIGWAADSIQFNATTYYATSCDCEGHIRPDPIDSFIDIGAYESIYKSTPVNVTYYTAHLAHIKLYPNPTHALLNIETEQSGTHSIEIISMTGQLVHRAEMNGTTNQIDMTPFENGVYFVRVRSEEFVRTEKVLKIK